jgi:hypothetical protein
MLSAGSAGRLFHLPDQVVQESHGFLQKMR